MTHLSRPRASAPTVMAGVLSILALLSAAVLIPGSIPSGQAATVARNLIANASMETAAGSHPAGWSSLGSGVNKRTFRYLSGGASAGHRFVRTLVSTRSTGSAGWSFTPVAVKARTAYVYSDASRGDTRSVVQVRLVSTTGRASYLVLGTPGPSARWSRTAYTFTVPAGTARLTVQHLIVSAGTLDVDAASLSIATTVASTTPKPVTVTPKPPVTPPSDPPKTVPPTTPPVVTPPTNPVPAGHGLVSVTFDDGLSNQYANAFPVLKQNGIPATFYLITSLLGANNYMSVSQGRDLQTAGEEIGSHTVTHRDLTSLSPADLTAELANSKSILESQFGTIRSLAYPFGSANGAVEAEAAKYYATARTTNGGVNLNGSYDPFALRMRYVFNTTTAATVASWMTEAKNTGGWTILVYHGIADSGDQYTTTPSMFAAHMAAVKASGLPTVTVSAGRAATS